MPRALVCSVEEHSGNGRRRMNSNPPYRTQCKMDSHASGSIALRSLPVFAQPCECQFLGQHVKRLVETAKWCQACSSSTQYRRWCGESGECGIVLWTSTLRSPARAWRRRQSFNLRRIRSGSSDQASEQLRPLLIREPHVGQLQLYRWRCLSRWPTPAWGRYRPAERAMRARSADTGEQLHRK